MAGGELIGPMFSTADSLYSGCKKVTCKKQINENRILEGGTVSFIYLDRCIFTILTGGRFSVYIGLSSIWSSG